MYVNKSEVVVVSVRQTLNGQMQVIAIDLNNGRLALLDTDGDVFEDSSEFYERGEIWELEGWYYGEKKPHKEKYTFKNGVMRRTIGNVKELILEKGNTVFGHPHSLFDGQLWASEPGRGYISEKKSEIPNYSFQFWQPQYSLEYDAQTRVFHYPLVKSQQVREPITVISCNTRLKSPREIPAKSLLLVSLSDWQPIRNLIHGNMCFLNISDIIT